MNKTNTLQDPAENITPPQQISTPPAEIYRVYSLISSNYCNLTNLFNNIISKTSSSKREIYQEINARLRVDQVTFNDTFNTLCNMEQGGFCNYNQLIYRTFENFIDLADSLSNLATLSLNTPDYDTVNRLRNNAFDLFRAFINARPIRY